MRPYLLSSTFVAQMVSRRGQCTVACRTVSVMRPRYDRSVSIVVHIEAFLLDIVVSTSQQGAPEISSVPRGWYFGRSSNGPSLIPEITFSIVMAFSGLAPVEPARIRNGHSEKPNSSTLRRSSRWYPYPVGLASQLAFGIDLGGERRKSGLSARRLEELCDLGIGLP
jgi:hypothetical protein